MKINQLRELDKDCLAKELRNVTMQLTLMKLNGNNKNNEVKNCKGLRKHRARILTVMNKSKK